jgi:pimeloyl-ACP methyl ester carboxylesterase
VADYVEDLVRFLDRRGLESVAVVGSSSGGLVSQRLAADHPDRVSALVLVGVPHALPRLDIPDLFKNLTDPLEPGFVRSLNEGLTYRPLEPGIAEAAVAESLKAPARVWTETLQGLFAEPPPSRRAPIRARTLVLWGEHDSILGRDQQDALLDDIPDARLVVLAETGHLPIWECPDRVAAEIAAFV